MAIHTATATEVDVPTLYALLRLRVDVFVVEQASAYPELDGRDLEAGTLHCWVDEGAGPVACLRILEKPVGQRISRVVTAPRARGRGLAGQLLRYAIDRCGRPVSLSAQAHLAGWYEGFGFEVAGPGYDEDGIPHLPMIIAGGP